MAIEFIPTDIQEMLRDGLRRWGGARDVREAEDFAQTWSFAAEQGWLAAGLPEEEGGLGGSAFDTAVIAEEFGRALIRAPFTEAAACAFLASRIGLDSVGAIAAGEIIPGLAHDEPQARGDPDWIETQATRDGDNWLLSGTKGALIGAGHASEFWISARYPDGGIGLFAIDADNAPLEAYTTFDDRSGGTLQLDRTEARLVAAPEIAAQALAAALDFRLVLESFEVLGAMERASELTREYLMTRKQYGQLIGDFQALRHRMADMFIETEQARSIAMRALGAVIDASDDSALLAAACRARVAQAAHFVCAQAIQLHGGIGVTDEYPVGHFYKRALAFGQRHGGGERQVERFAELSA